MDTLLLIKEKHLKELDIPLGPRLLILKAIQQQQQQEEEEVTTSSSEEEDDSSEEEDDSSEEEEEEEEEMKSLQKRRRQRFLGELQWETECVIDFGDTKSGDPLYDLVAVFLLLYMGILFYGNN
jgi:TATA-binding protein-associated factor Taf7